MRSSHRLSKGLFFFPLKTNILQNEKIKILRADQGHTGFACFIYLLCRLFGNDEEYYKKFGHREKKLFCEDEKIEREILDCVLNICFEEDIFEAAIYDKYEILTSENIQLTWLDVTHRRGSITMIKEYLLLDTELPLCKSRLTVIGLNKIIHREATPREKVDQKTPKIVDTVTEPIHDAFSESETDLMPGTGNFLTVEVKAFCELNYDRQNEKFKKQIDKDSFESYKKFNDLIDKDFLPLRSSNKQVTYPDFIKLSVNAINGKVPTKAEILSALKKLTGTGVNLNTSIYHKLLDYIEYVREPKNLNGKNGNHSEAGKTGHKIDHSKSAENF